MSDLLRMLTNPQDGVTTIQYIAYSMVGASLSLLADAQPWFRTFLAVKQPSPSPWAAIQLEASKTKAEVC